MKASRPYLVRALYGWIVDNGMTPYLLVDADLIHVQVPREHVNNGKIVLNLDPDAVQGLELGNQAVRFSARFASGHLDCYIPIPAVLAIYASENGKGMFFNHEDLGDEPFESTEDESGGSTSGSAGKTTGKKVSHLTVIK
jgi:stringent starvation protein B